ncbi:unnamed protein product [Didymodactylos carnosus]|uniref:C2H2-type domain-containing protein n=1 Tax=Didymodactylos carnosus TaxID=1234261 RepID=A0A814JG80_9BILA|nr:unnamed protein product [Didymodactylos carnosus]CAF3806057.1 unnamed protein product [Didymodactylos carnosus]
MGDNFLPDEALLISLANDFFISESTDDYNRDLNLFEHDRDTTSLLPATISNNNYQSEQTPKNIELLKPTSLPFTFDRQLSLSTCQPSTFRTHFNLNNPDEYKEALSLIKNSVVQIKRLTNQQLISKIMIKNQKILKKPSMPPPSNVPTTSSYDLLPRVRGPRSARFTCPICGLITVSMDRLQRHVAQHGQKLHLETYKPERKVSTLVCERCKATFSSAYALRKHQRVHTRDKPFSCDFCGSRFSQWGNLRHHIQRHLGISPYACPYCKKTFIAPCKLEVHIRGHLDERPYVCERCQATFRCNDDLRKHMIIHADYKPFVCWLCTKQFFHASKLRTHLKEKHEIEVVIRKKDVLESGTEYEITVVNQNDLTSINQQQNTNDKHIAAITLNGIQDQLQDESSISTTFLDTTTPHLISSMTDESADDIIKQHVQQCLNMNYVVVDSSNGDSLENFQTLNDLNVSDIEQFVKNNPFVTTTVDSELVKDETDHERSHHNNHNHNHHLHSYNFNHNTFDLGDFHVIYCQIVILYQTTSFVCITHICLYFCLAKIYKYLFKMSEIAISVLDWLAVSILNGVYIFNLNDPFQWQLIRQKDPQSPLKIDQNNVIKTTDENVNQSEIELNRNIIIFSPNGEYLAFNDQKNILYLYEYSLSTIPNIYWKHLKTIRVKNSISTFYLTNDLLFIADKGNGIYKYEFLLKQNSEITNLDNIMGYLPTIFDVCYVKYSITPTTYQEYLLTGDRDGKICLSHPHMHNTETYYLGHQDFVSNIKLINNNHFISTSGDGTLRLWRISDCLPLVVLHMKAFINSTKFVFYSQLYTDDYNVEQIDDYISVLRGNDMNSSMIDDSNSSLQDYSIWKVAIACTNNDNDYKILQTSSTFIALSLYCQRHHCIYLTTLSNLKTLNNEQKKLFIDDSYGSIIDYSFSPNSSIINSSTFSTKCLLYVLFDTNTLIQIDIIEILKCSVNYKFDKIISPSVGAINQILASNEFLLCKPNDLAYKQLFEIRIDNIRYCKRKSEHDQHLKARKRQIQDNLLLEKYSEKND